MGGHYAGALAYADDITLISPSMTGLRKMNSIYEQHASEYDILFNGSKSKLLFFNGRCCYVSTFSIVVCFQLVEISDTATFVHCFVFVVFSVINLRFGGYTNLQL